MNTELSGLTGMLHWLGHAGFRLDSSHGAIYFDPYRLNKTGNPPAALLLLSHEHSDHCSLPDLNRLLTAQTIICAPPAVAEHLEANVEIMAPGDCFIPWPGVEVRAVAAYNLNKAFHPRADAGLGFILNLEGINLYHAGDTDFIPEMRGFSADIALLPVSGTYTMNFQEAAEAALALQPRLAVPMHYGTIVGQEEDARRFAKALEGRIPVAVLAQE